MGVDEDEMEGVETITFGGHYTVVLQKPKTPHSAFQVLPVKLQQAASSAPFAMF
jgi:hypothetical protein